MQSRNWCFTLNNYDEKEVEQVKCIDCVYCVFGYEVGEEGTPHLQGYVVFQTNQRLPAMKKRIPRAHFSMARGDSEQNFIYCSKQGNFVEWGDRPKTQMQKGQMEKDRWDDIKAKAKANQLEEIDSKTYVLHYSTLRKIAKDNMTIPPNLDAVCGRWYYGPSGTGKTTAARTEFPDAFIKSRDRWWDGYQGQEVVILDDIDKYNVSLGAYLKDWGDKWSYKAEDKGGCHWIRPKIFIVTSQYTIEQIFDDPETQAALNRRYEKKHFLIKYIP